MTGFGEQGGSSGRLLAPVSPADVSDVSTLIL